MSGGLTVKFRWVRRSVRHLCSSTQALCEAQISKAQLQQRGEGNGDTVDVENDPQMLALTAEIDEKVQASEAQGEAGNVDESMALLEQAESE